MHICTVKQIQGVQASESAVTAYQYYNKVRNSSIQEEKTPKIKLRNYSCHSFPHPGKEATAFYCLQSTARQDITYGFAIRDMTTDTWMWLFKLRPRNSQKRKT